MRPNGVDPIVKAWNTRASAPSYAEDVTLHDCSDEVVDDQRKVARGRWSDIVPKARHNRLTYVLGAIFDDPEPTCKARAGGTMLNRRKEGLQVIPGR